MTEFAEIGDWTTQALDAAPVIDARRMRRFAAMMLAVATAVLVAMVFLPHDPYLRYKAAAAQGGGLFPKADWIYERTHFDPTPIDVMFVGTSRTGGSIESTLIEKRLAAAGIPQRVVNFNLPRTGLNLPYVIFKDVIKTRKVSTLVIEMTDIEDRFGHPQFIYLADPMDVIKAPMLINLSYPGDLIRLPGRQLSLALETLKARLGLADDTFHPARYKGANYDRVRALIGTDGVVHSRDRITSRAELERDSAEWNGGVTRNVLPAWAGDYEFKQPRYYRRALIDLARANGVRVVFLYLPRYKGVLETDIYRRYAKDGPLINVSPLVQDPACWLNASHINMNCGLQVSHFVGDELAKILESGG